MSAAAKLPVMPVEEARRLARVETLRWHAANNTDHEIRAKAAELLKEMGEG
jgi:hypothetical protein